MTGPAANPYASNRHADVLHEDPSDEPTKKRLCEEVKMRAKGAFQSKDMPSAELLYGKAIKLQESMDGSPVEATLYSNRSMVRLNLNKVEGALDDANKCIKLDPKFVKAYHRKAQALVRLNEWDDAISTAEEGKKMDPENKAFQEVIDKATADKEKDVKDKANLKRDAQDVRVELHNASTARQPVKPKKTENGGEDLSMRGYKTTSDGKKTSYFHTEISEEAKALIAAQGFGKPQKLETPVEDKEGKGGGSTWNQAGTYEEKNMMKWLTDRLKEKLVGISMELPGNWKNTSGAISITGIEEVKGDATISMSRGKRRHVLDLALEVHCECKLAEESGKAKYHISEVNTGDDDREVKLDIDSGCPPNPRAAFKEFGTSEHPDHGFQGVVIKALYAVVEEYKGK
eukprot:TRINITY_DN20428_c0_g1_i1.p1 TRINITY_DN20428_c0_g1~~TRINITY_DN20428_c0_g1_i1.p1  ORF type:complete len:401 (+),score=144.26 TRINITY_DN20428_c0_g1_i1:70-1272(+)